MRKHCSDRPGSHDNRYNNQTGNPTAPPQPCYTYCGIRTTHEKYDFILDHSPQYHAL